MGYSGIVSVDQANCLPGGKGSVSVRIRSNDIPIAGMVIPLKYTNPDLVVDSVSYVGALGAGMARIGSVDQTAKTARLIIYSDPGSSSITTISAPSGVLGVIFYHVKSTAAPAFASVDSINTSVNLGQNVVLTTRIEFSDATGLQTLLPGFESGGVTIQSPTDVNDDQSVPSVFEVAQNYPNPFNPTTSLQFSLPKAGNVRVEVFNVLGQSVDVLADGHREAGQYTLTFNASAQPSGVYFYRVDYDGHSETRKMLLLK